MDEVTPKSPIAMYSVQYWILKMFGLKRISILKLKKVVPVGV